MEKLSNIVKTESVSRDNINCLYETSKLWLSACAIPVTIRKGLLSESLQTMQEQATDHNGVEYKYDEETDKCIKNVYTRGLNILNNNSSKPIIISEQTLSKIVNSYEKIKNDKCIEKFDDNEIIVEGIYENGVFDCINRFGRMKIEKDKLILLIQNNKVQKPTGKMWDTLGKYFNTNKNTIKVRCVNKVYDKSRLVGYIIIDDNGKTMQIKKEELKQAIRNGQIDCINLTLTSDNRLMFKN